MYLKKWTCRAGIMFASLLLIGCLPGTGGVQTPEIVLPSPTSPLLLTPESGVAVITADGATIRAEPRLSSQSLGQLQRGTPVTILASIEEPGWRLVRIDLPGAGRSRKLRRGAAGGSGSAIERFGREKKRCT